MEIFRKFSTSQVILFLFILALPLQLHAQMPPAWEPLGYFPVVGVTRQIKLSGNYAYLAADQIGMSIVDITTDPKSPTVYGISPMPFSGRSLAVFGTRAAVIGERYTYDDTLQVQRTSAIYIFDVSDPASPRIGASISGSFGSVAISGDYLYAVATDGLRVINIRDPQRLSSRTRFMKMMTF